jgi:hypothetical protein
MQALAVDAGALADEPEELLLQRFLSLGIRLAEDEPGRGGSSSFARSSVSHPLSLVTKHKPPFEKTRE